LEVFDIEYGYLVQKGSNLLPWKALIYSLEFLNSKVIFEKFVMHARLNSKVIFDKFVMHARLNLNVQS
jgi:hypothetical protein